ncbi:glycine cleavage system transcriptional repressor [Aeromonas veronii]|nr:glycine cleavage system transcriptional repressor [Aeromonas veronii]
MDFSPDFQGRNGKADPFEKQGREGASRDTIRNKKQWTKVGSVPQGEVIRAGGLACQRGFRNEITDERRFMTHYLVVTAIGTDRPGIVNEVTRHVSGCGCNIVDSRLGIFGNEFTFIMLLSGDWNSMMQLEISLPLRSQEWDLITMMKRTERHQSLQYDIRASADLLIRDEPGIVSQCTQFFSEHGWNIQAMQSMTLEQQPFNLLKISFQLNLAREGEVEGSQTAFAEFCRQLGAESFEFIVNRKHA